jgi:hypothetical protein
MNRKIAPEAGHRTQAEKAVSKKIERIFLASADSVEVRLDNFTKYVREQKLRRLFALYEIFRKVLPVKGSAKGLKQGQTVESFVLLSALGGECIDDMEHLRDDAGLSGLLGYRPPAPEAIEPLPLGFATLRPKAMAALG